MAIDKAIDSAQLDAGLTSIADSIRAKGGTSDELAFPGGFVDAIGAISAGGGGLPYWSGQLTLTNTGWLYITHGLGSDKLLVILDAVEYPAEVGKNAYTTYRILAWSSDVLTPHIRYPVGDKSEAPYADENVGISTLRVANAGLSSGGATVTQFQVATANRGDDEGTSNPGMMHSDNNNTVLLTTNRTIYYPAVFNCVVIDISNCGIRYTEEG